MDLSIEPVRASPVVQNARRAEGKRGDLVEREQVDT